LRRGVDGQNVLRRSTYIYSYRLREYRRS